MSLANKRKNVFPVVSQTLGGHAQAGNLPRLQATTLRAQLATGTPDHPSDVRRAATALLQRVLEYWRFVDYCHPALTLSSGEQPRAIPAPQFTQESGQLRQGLQVNDPLDGPLKVWNEAMAMCLNTALLVAQWELATAMPEAGDLLRKGRVAGLSACKSEAIAGSPWGKTSMRISTVGVRKRVLRALGELPSTWLVLHPDSGAPAFYSTDDYARIGPVFSRRALENNHPLLVCAPRLDAERAAA
ncbi:hypothetical protein [Paraburkholderia sp. SIMBA_054]|uniref:hypothetical protein n=1 Tax=Paraburkholderia sp. SIMBA_054 TaxID=3085795 RepID=UPI00397D5A25